MRVPHTVPENTLRAYSPSPQTLGLEGERSRRLRSERFDWDAGAPAPLAEQCVRALVADFEAHRRALPLMGEADAILLLETLPTSLSLETVLPLVPDGVYWRRRCRDTWAAADDVATYGGSWKKMFVERFVQEAVESEEPDLVDPAELQRTLKLCAPYVRSLRVTQLRPPATTDSPLPDGFVPERLDLGPVLGALTGLRELSLQFGVKGLGTAFAFGHFRLHPNDVERLAGGLRSTRNLRTLRITRSDVDDAKLDVILRALAAGEGLELLEVAHCRVSDAGGESLGRFLEAMPMLKHLGLQNNRIGADGAGSLARALTADGVLLERLDLKFNPIGDRGGRAVAGALAECGRPRHAVLAGCGLGEEAGLALVRALRADRTLTLDLANNPLGEEVGYMVAKAMERNRTALKLDVRNCGFDERCEGDVHRATFRNREGVRRAVPGAARLAVPEGARRGTSFVEGILVS